MNVFAPRLFWFGGDVGVWLLMPFLLSVTITVDVVQALPNCNTCFSQFFCEDKSYTYASVYYQNYECTLCNVGYFLFMGSCLQCSAHCMTCDVNNCFYCFPGYYFITNAYNENQCYLCGSCVAGQAQTRPCLNNLNVICQDCASNQIAVNVGGGAQECRTCSAGTYRNANKLTCDTCTTCTSEQRVELGNECTLTKNRVCTNCPFNTASSVVNGATCDTCRPGYYLTGPGACTLCTSTPCDSGFYQVCSNAVRTCNLCTGLSASTKCPLKGYGPDKPTCPVGTITNTECKPCPAGSERPNLAVLQCSKCVDGFYKTLPSADDCQVCTNAPVDNSLYLPWGNAAATTANCEW
jgi:hypothetical protein